MIAGLIAVGCNVVLNYILIFGKFGTPALGVAGAADATVIARFVEAAIVIGWSHSHREKFPFLRHLYTSLRIPGELIRRMIITGAPLLVNETLWAAALSALTQCYSTRGLNAIAGINIANTLGNVFTMTYLAMGEAVAILIGQILGSGDMERARDADNRIIAFAVLTSIGVAALEMLIGPFFPAIYNTNADARRLAVELIMVNAICIPQNSYINACYFTLRCGGRTLVTFFFDSFFICCCSFPLAFCLSRFTTLPVLGIFIAVQAADLIKCVIGHILVSRGIWIRNITR